MARRVLGTAFLFFIVAPGFVNGAYAQDSAAASRLAFVPVSMLAPVVVPAVSTDGRIDDATVVADQTFAPIVQPYRRVETGTSPLLTSLYVATAITQALDIHSTMTALDRGGFETNPLLSGIAGNKPAFIAVKSAVAAGSIFAAHRMAKRNKVAAIATLLAINAAYGLVAHHNYKVAARLR